MLSFDQPKSHCPSCGYAMDMATPVAGENNPVPGSLSFCIKCGELLVFDPNLMLRLPTKEELTDLKSDKIQYAHLLKMQKMIRDFMALKKEATV